jgi:hypothetical protein
VPVAGQAAPRLRPSANPCSANVGKNGALSLSDSDAGDASSCPIRNVRWDFCAKAVRANAALPIKAMKLRRLMRRP